MDKLVAYVIFGVAFVAFIGLTAVIFVPTEGDNYCEKKFYKHRSDMANNSVIIKTLWTRTLDDHWISALVVQPKDIDKKESTIICHFKRTNYVFDKIEIHQGDKINRIKRVSMSNFDPRTWFQ